MVRNACRKSRRPALHVFSFCWFFRGKRVTRTRTWWCSWVLHTQIVRREWLILGKLPVLTHEREWSVQNTGSNRRCVLHLHRNAGEFADAQTAVWSYQDCERGGAHYRDVQITPRSRLLLCRPSDWRFGRLICIRSVWQQGAQAARRVCEYPRYLWKLWYCALCCRQGMLILLVSDTL
jgi:hypothetical protein